jgi:CheY-like chemotaxis protein
MSFDAPTRLLLVDDDEDSLQGLTLLLRHAGYDVRASASAGDALEVAKSFAPKVVILDIGLPEVSGVELAHRLKSTFAGGECVLMALTGYAEAPAGADKPDPFDHYFTKPVDTAVLLGTLKEISDRPPIVQ